MKHFVLSVAITIGLAGAALAQEPVWDGNTVILESQKIAGGVFAVIPTGAAEMATAGYPIATTGGFVIGETGVLVIESMLNQRLNTQLLNLITAKTDQPVRYLVNSSYHGDHAYGNQYLPDGVIVIQHANTAAYIAEHLEADKAFMIQNFGQGRGIEEVVATDAETQVVPGHGPVTDITAIKWSVDYLTAIETEVLAAIADDLSVEDTVTRAQLSDFQGYALFGWVHPNMNVPAAYSDLK